MASINYNQKCEFCGNNQVPHFANWYFESLNVFLSVARKLILYNPLAMLIKKIISKFSCFKKFVHFLVFIKVIKWETHRENCKIPRAQVLWQEAEARGYKMKQAVLYGKPLDIYSVTNRNTEIVFSGLPRPRNYDDSSLDWMDDKQILKSKFFKSAIPVPIGGSAWTFSQAKKIFEHIQKNRGTKPSDSVSVIVKPRAGSRGRHSTTYISNLVELKKAYKIAKQLCFWVIVEEQLFGPVYRATLINYELCGVLRGDSPQVQGDGVHSIKELIEEKNKSLHAGVKDIVADNEMEKFVERGLYRKMNENKITNVWTYVPMHGEVVQLSEKIGVSYGGSSSEDFEICHEDNTKLFVEAAKFVADPIIGFDFIIPDITKSWKEQKCGFLEANSLPFINLHHNPLLGQPKNVAAKVWDMIFK